MLALTIRRRYSPMFHELPPEIASACNLMMMMMTVGGGGAMLAPFNLIRDNLNLSNSIPAKRNFLCCSFASIYINNFLPSSFGNAYRRQAEAGHPDPYQLTGLGSIIDPITNQSRATERQPRVRYIMIRAHPGMLCKGRRSIFVEYTTPQRSVR